MMMHMGITKAIIATAGYGTRRLPITKTIDKNMLPIGNRPVIDYVVEECVLAGIEDIYLVVNDIKGQIRQYYDENVRLTKFLAGRGAKDKLVKAQTAPEGVRLHYVEQDVNDKYGTSVPVALVVREFGVDEQIVFCNGDDPFWKAKDGSDVKTLIEGVRSEDEAALMGYVVEKKDMGRYGMIIKNDEDMMTGLIEKPKPEEVTGNLANINRFVLSRELLRMIVEYTDENDFGPMDQEYMITDPIFKFIKVGGKMRVVASTGEWMDCGSLEGWLKANNTVCAG